jgi:hypothetical protein
MKMCNCSVSASGNRRRTKLQPHYAVADFGARHVEIGQLGFGKQKQVVQVIKAVFAHLTFADFFAQSCDLIVKVLHSIVFRAKRNFGVWQSLMRQTPVLARLRRPRRVGSHRRPASPNRKFGMVVLSTIRQLERQWLPPPCPRAAKACGSSDRGIADCDCSQRGSQRGITRGQHGILDEFENRPHDEV